MWPGTRKFYRKPCAASGSGTSRRSPSRGGLPRLGGWNKLPSDWRLIRSNAARNAVLSRGGWSKHEPDAGGLDSTASKRADVLPVAWRSAPAAHASGITQTVSEELDRHRYRRSRRCALHRDFRAAESHDERQGGTSDHSRDSAPRRGLRRDGADRSGAAIGDCSCHGILRTAHDYTNRFHEVFAEEFRPHHERDTRAREAPARSGHEDREPCVAGRLRTRRATSIGYGRNRRRAESDNQEAAQEADREDDRGDARDGDPRYERHGDERTHRGSRASNPASRVAGGDEVARRSGRVSALLQNPVQVAVVLGPQRYPPCPGSIRQCAGRVFVGSFFFPDLRARTRAIAAYSTIRPMPEKTAVCIVM